MKPGNAPDSNDLTQSQTVLRRLRELIMGGEFPPGTKLKAAYLAERLDTSRTPVTSALAVLEAEGLVSYSSRRGYTTIEITVQDLLDALELRATLAALAVEIVARRGLDEKLFGFLTAKIDQTRDLLDGGQWTQDIESQWYEANYDFHRAIVKTARNRHLESAMTRTLIAPVADEGLNITIYGRRKTWEGTLEEAIPEHVFQSQMDHERLLSLLKVGDGRRAGNVMYEHVMTTYDRVLKMANTSK